MLLVQLEINSTRDVWKFCQIGLAPAAQTSLILLIPNCTRQRMITYTNNHTKDTRNKAILVKLPKVKLEFNRQAF